MYGWRSPLQNLRQGWVSSKALYKLVQGHSGKPVGIRNGRSAVQTDVLKWRAGRGVPKPQARKVHPITDELGLKIVHFSKLTGLPAYNSLHSLESTIRWPVPRLTWFWIVWRQSHRSYIRFSCSQRLRSVMPSSSSIQERPSKAKIGTYGYVWICIECEIMWLSMYWYVCIPHETPEHSAGFFILHPPTTELSRQKVQVLLISRWMLVWKSGIAVQGACAKR